MEGVVLYVALVRVFAEHYGRYMAAFTIASYGEEIILKVFRYSFCMVIIYFP